MEQHWYFYPRPPRGGRQSIILIFSRAILFLSTPSSRRATSDPIHGDPVPGFLSTPSARRATGRGGTETPFVSFLSTPSARRATPCVPSAKRSKEISIHALREEGDQLIYRGATQVALFLSTPSARRATRPLCPVWPRRGISIHALREEGDPLAAH